MFQKNIFIASTSHRHRHHKPSRIASHRHWRAASRHRYERHRKSTSTSGGRGPRRGAAAPSEIAYSYCYRTRKSRIGNKLQLILPNKRIHFAQFNEEHQQFEPKKQPSFDCIYIFYKMNLPSDIFRQISINLIN